MRKLRVELEECDNDFQYHIKILETWALSDYWYNTPQKAVEAAVRHAKRLHILFERVVVINCKHMPNPKELAEWLEKQNATDAWRK